MHRQAEHLIQQEFEQITFFDNGQARLAWEYAHKHKNPFPPSLIITVADHEVDTSWHEQARADGAHIDHVVLPAPDPTAQLDLLYQSAPHIKSVVCVYTAYSKELPPHLARRFEIARKWCDQRGIVFTTAGDYSVGDMMDTYQQVSTSQVDACFFYQDSIAGRTAARLVNDCTTRGIIVCAGGTTYSQIAPLSYGYNLLELREYLSECCLAQITHQDISVPVLPLDAPNLWYSININHALCARYELNTHITGYRRVDTMHERNIAACMNATPRLYDPSSDLHVDATHNSDEENVISFTPTQEVLHD